MEQRRFDPYRKWLGIPEGQRPPTHYQLLGISPDEQDRDVINAAVVRHSAYVRTFQVGHYSNEATQLLNEIAAAKVCLLDPRKRALYDAELCQTAYHAEQSLANPPRRLRAPPRRMDVVDVRPEFSLPEPAVLDLFPPLPVANHQAPAIPLASDVVQTAVQTETGTSFMWIGLTLVGLAVPISLLLVILTDKPPHASNHVAQAPSVSVVAGTVSVSQGPVPPPQITGGPATLNALDKTAAPAPALEPAMATDEENPLGEDDVPGAPWKPSAAASAGDREAERRSEEFFDRIERNARDERQRDSLRRARANFKLHHSRFSEPDVGEDTPFVGHDGGGSRRIVKAESLLCGVECELGNWGREKCIKAIEPLFSRETTGRRPIAAVARDGYAVGAVKIHTYAYVDALQLIFMRVKNDGQLDPDDSYTGDWLGFRGRGKTYTLTGNGSPIIGIHARQGLILDALALVVDTGSAKSSASP